MQNVLRRSSSSAAFFCLIVLSAAVSNAQLDAPLKQPPKQVAAALPKLALKGAAGETKKGVQYHKIVLEVLNRDKYDTGMFFIPEFAKLPPNPCTGARTRIVRAIYDSRGNQYSKCVAVPNRDALDEVSLLIEKGKPLPQFVYLVLTDQLTGGAYRSNQVSPSTGEIK